MRVTDMYKKHEPEFYNCSMCNKQELNTGGESDICMECYESYRKSHMIRIPVIRDNPLYCNYCFEKRRMNVDYLKYEDN